MKTETTKFAYVDMLRGIAILMVVMVHAAQRVPNLYWLADNLAQYGQMGVQLFFVASAYTLCLSFSKSTGSPLRVISFYIRRFFRIAPLYYIGITIYFILNVAINFYHLGSVAPIYPYTFTNVFANVFFIHGLFPQANNNIVPGGWSIGTEMLFYLAFPALFMGISKLTERFGVSIIVVMFAIVVMINAAMQAFLAVEFDLKIINNKFLYFNIINQLPVFIIGIFAFHATRDIDNQGMSNSMAVRRSYGFGFTLLSIVAIVIYHKCNCSYKFAVIPIISGASFYCLLAYLKMSRLRFNILSRIGQLSYSVYIFHFIAAWYLVPLMVEPLQNKLPSVIHLFISFFLSIGFTVLLAIFSEKYIEARGIHVGSMLIDYLQKRANTIEAKRR